MTRPPFASYEWFVTVVSVASAIAVYVFLFLLLGCLIEGAPPAPWPRTNPLAWVAIPLLVFALGLFVTMRIVSGVVQAVKGAFERLDRDANTASTELARTKADLARTQKELAERTGELTVLRAGFGAIHSADAEAVRLRAEVDRLTRLSGRADPVRKEALARLLEERAVAREDALLDADDAVREARLAAIDDEFGPRIEAAYDAV